MEFDRDEHKILDEIADTDEMSLRFTKARMLGLYRSMIVLAILCVPLMSFAGIIFKADKSNWNPLFFMLIFIPLMAGNFYIAWREAIWGTIVKKLQNQIKELEHK